MFENVLLFRFSLLDYVRYWSRFLQIFTIESNGQKHFLIVKTAAKTVKPTPINASFLLDDVITLRTPRDML